MTIRLNGQTSGYVELEAPATAGSNTLVLPTGNGTSGQYLQTNGSGALSWQTVTPAAFETYAIICDQKAQNTAGGSFTSGAWRTRDLNTEIFDPDGIVSISSNQFTLSAGNYYIEWSCPGHGINQNQSRLQDITGTATIQAGTSEFCSNSGGAFEQTRSFGSSRVSITSNNVYEIQHRATTTKAGNGFGVLSNFTVEIYTIVKIFKEA